MPEHELNPSCAVRFSKLDEAHKDMLRRLDRMETDIHGNGKAGLKQDVAEVKRDVDDVCQSNNRIEEKLERFVADYHSAMKTSGEGDKNRKTEITKVIMSNSGQIILAIAQMLMLYWFWRQTGIAP